MSTLTPPTEPVDVEALFSASVATVVSQPKRRRWGRRLTVLVLVVFLILTGTIAVTEAGWLNTGIDRLYGKSRLALFWGGMPADANTALRYWSMYASKMTLPDTFSFEESTSLDATLYTSSLNSLFGYNNAHVGNTVPTEETSFYQMLDSTVNQLPTQTEIPTQTIAPVTEDITAKANLSVDGTVLQSNKQFMVHINFSAESTIPNWKSLSATTNIIRDDDQLYIQVPDLSSWPIAESIIAPYRAFYGKFVKIPFEATVADEYDQITQQEYLSNEQRDRLLASIAKRTRRIGIERVDGYPASHWQFSLYKDSLIDLLQETSDTLATGTPADSPINQTNLNEVTDQVEQLRRSLPDFTLSLDFWVRRGDYVVVKSSESFVIDSSYLKANLITNGSTINIPAKKLNSIPSESDTITQDEFMAALTTGADSTTVTDTSADTTTAYGRDQQRIADLAAIESELTTLGFNGNRYPLSDTVSHLDDPATAVAAALGTTYKDPLPEQYYYGYTSDGITYTLSAVIEDPTLTTCTPTGSICLYTVTRTHVN